MYSDISVSEFISTRVILENIPTSPEKYEFKGSSNEVKSSILPGYTGVDIFFLDDANSRHSWQNALLKYIYTDKESVIKKADDRSVIWIQDSKGFTGKSKFVKWFCFNHRREAVKLSFGSTNQLKSVW